MIVMSSCCATTLHPGCVEKIITLRACATICPVCFVELSEACAEKILHVQATMKKLSHSRRLPPLRPTAHKR